MLNIRTLTAVLISVALCATICVYCSFAENKSPHELFKEAQEFLNQGMLDKAEANCKRILRWNPNVYPVYNVLGLIYTSRTGQEEKAIMFFNKSLEISQKQPAIYNEVAVLYNKIGQKKKAVSLLEEGLKHNPDDFSLNYNLGLIYLTERRDAEKASEFFSAAQEQAPDKATVIFVTGFSNILAGHKLLALESITKLRQLNEEGMAAKLETLMRGQEEGRKIDVGSTLMDNMYNRQEPEPAQRSLNNNPASQVRGRGELLLQTTVKPKQQ